MACTSRTTCKSTVHPPVGQLAPQNVQQPQEPPHNTPHYISQEEETFVIKLVVLVSPAA
jgi:hypothetical protein